MQEVYTLAYYTEQVKARSDAELAYIVADCNAALDAHRDSNDAVYIRKLYNELDAARSEIQRRQRR